MNKVNAKNFFTVFTPTYNRRKLLSRVYESLLEQTYQEFDWLIVDDGSSDGTREYVEELINSNPLFSIEYYYQENAGKHGAHNAAIERASGFAIVIVDSDDWLKPCALQLLKEEWDKLPNPEKFVGVFGLFAYEDGTIVGNHFPKDALVSNAIDLRHNLKVRGDKIGFNRTDVLRKFPFPDNLGKYYVSESLVWNRISQEYDSLFVNQVIGIKEYQPGGITDNSALNDYRNPLAGYTNAMELVNGRVNIPFIDTLRALGRILKCAYYAKLNPFVVRRLNHKLLMLPLIPAAGLVIIRDLNRVKKRRQKAKVIDGAVVS